MIYATVNDVREALAPEGDFSNAATAASLSDAQLTDALVEASSEVDAKVKGAPYASNVPPIVQSITRDVAAYKAMLTHSKTVELPPTHPVALRFAWAEGMLTLATQGKLDMSQTAEEAATSEAAVVNAYSGDLFTLEGMGLGPSRELPPWMR